MPDPEIVNALPTHSPSPEFVADTRQLLSAAWRQPTSTGAERTNITPQGTTIMNTTLQPPDYSTDRNTIDPRSPHSRGPNPRWIASIAAAALVVVGGVILVNYNKGGDEQAPATATQPATTVTNTAPSPTTVPPVTSLVTPATQPPATTPQSTPATPPATPAPQPVTDNTPAPQTTPQPAPTNSTYTEAAGPAWAQVDATAPVANFPADGVYGSDSHQVNGDTVTFTLTQYLFNEACNTYYSVPVDQYADECAGGYASIDQPSATIAIDPAATVIADFNLNENIVTYQVPAAEFAHLLAGQAPSDASAPSGLSFWSGPILVQVQGGKVTAVRSLAWS